jgi:PhzF family phenazine biosynthesis protein
MKLPLYQLDAFTSRLFRGNPAAVVVMDQWLDDTVLQAIAAENNLSETAFETEINRHSLLSQIAKRFAFLAARRHHVDLEVV